MNDETKLPEALEAAQLVCAAAGLLGVPDAAAHAAFDAIRAEHALRLSLQHHAADMAQRVADLEAERDDLRHRAEEWAAELQAQALLDLAVEVERDELRARMAQIEAQEPVDVQVRAKGSAAWARPDQTKGEPTPLLRAQYLCGRWPGRYEMRQLYARPVPAIPADPGMLTVSMAASSAYAMGWNDCRAKMINAAQEVKA